MCAPQGQGSLQRAVFVGPGQTCEELLPGQPGGAGDRSARECPGPPAQIFAEQPACSPRLARGPRPTAGSGLPGPQGRAASPRKDKAGRHRPLKLHFPGGGTSRAQQMAGFLQISRGCPLPAAPAWLPGPSPTPRPAASGRAERPPHGGTSPPLCCGPSSLPPPSRLVC